MESHCLDIATQLTNIYFTDETWHNSRMTYENAFQYHKTRFEHGYIHVYEENGEVLGYYERYIRDNTCILYNVWVKESERKGKVFKELYRHFFMTMPKNITEVIGEKVKLGGKFRKRIIRRQKWEVQKVLQ